MLLIKETFCKQEFVSFYIYANEDYVENQSDFESINMENWKANFFPGSEQSVLSAH